MFGGVKTMLNMVFLKNFTYLKTKFFLTIYSHVIPSLLNPITIINNIKIYNHLLLIKKNTLFDKHILYTGNYNKTIKNCSGSNSDVFWQPLSLVIILYHHHHQRAVFLLQGSGVLVAL